MDITQASAEHQVCKAQFDTAMAKLSEQESLITNLEATIEQRNLSIVTGRTQSCLRWA